METLVKASLVYAILVFVSVSMPKASADASNDWRPFPPKVHVHITNNVPDKATIVVHCKSRDDDLGAQYIASGQVYEFAFYVNFTATTLFFCGYHWQAKNVIGDAFDANRDGGRCKHKCDWTVDGTGIHGMNEFTGVVDYVYPWK
ncbi:hypothetical protein Droror1_Dr00023128 [Drosera rotundifolia]